MSESDPGLSRRQLIAKTGAALAAGFTIVRPESVRGSQANSKITVGLIGAGGRGQYDAGIFNADPRARVTALCDLFDDRIEIGTQKIKIEKPAVYKDYEKLLAANDIDAVSSPRRPSSTRACWLPPSKRASMSTAKSPWAWTWRA